MNMQKGPNDTNQRQFCKIVHVIKGLIKIKQEIIL
jgi:hypothetical protein